MNRWSDNRAVWCVYKGDGGKLILNAHKQLKQFRNEREK